MRPEAKTRDRRRTVFSAPCAAFALAGLFAFGAIDSPATASDGPDTRIDYSRDIRPILADQCLACHGPDAAERKADLRLDLQEDVRRDRDGRFVLVPGQPDESELIFRIESDEADVKMPPPKSGKSLSPEQVSLLRRWVEQGGNYTAHWAFIPPRRPALPQVANGGWVRTPLDAFVLSRLEHEGLAPSHEADRTTLIRRLSLDLVGLPPSIEDVDAFLADTGGDAYDRAVERLLSSPHYGERWGRIWLDAARYADSDGYEKDKARQVWLYRDWVIDALNRDLPYDQFIIEQIAGDLLPSATPSRLVATGFLRNSMINEEGGIDPEQFRMEAMFDRMDAVGTAVLGLTLKCAQCHSHKYDPISHEDYYRIFAYLNDCHEANVAVYPAEAEQRRAEILAEIDEIESALRHTTPDWRERMLAWEETLRAPKTGWTVIRPAVDDDSTGGQKYLLQDDGSFLAQGYAPTKHTVLLTVRVDQPRIGAIRLELLNDPNLPLGGPGRSIEGTGALSEITVEAAPADAPDKREAVKFATATADVNPPETPLKPFYDDKTDKKRVTGPVTYAIDGKAETAWGFDLGPGRRNAPHEAVFVFEQPVRNAAGTILTIRLAQNHGGWNSDDNQNCNLGRFRLSVTGAFEPVADPIPRGVREVLAIAPEKRTEAQMRAEFRYWCTLVPEWAEANAGIEDLWKQHPEPASQLVLQARAMPRTTSILHRGDFLKPTKDVDPGVPGFLNSEARGTPQDRLEFARWLVDRRAPTTARAIVNRVWQAYFGTGLVETPEDLGSQGSPSSHPELLDWLAVEFMENGWSLKALHRVIVGSATYRQSSHASAELEARDTANRLLARGARFRADAEVVRDIALAASGLLDDTVGGPSVNPPAPDFLFQPPASYGPKVWNEDKGPGRYRRALYTFRYRSVPYPMLQTFDAPNGDIACVRRSRSNTPLQALTVLNEPIFLECARALGLDALNQGGETDDERLVHAFRRCVARAPTDAERQTLLGLLERQKAHFGSGERDPWALAANDPANPPALRAGAMPADAAAWTAVARVLLNLDETISKE